MNLYKDAQDINNWAKIKYDEKKSLYEEAQKKCEKTIGGLDKYKTEIWASFSDFVKIFESIKNKPARITGTIGKEELDLSIDEIKEIKVNSSIAADVFIAGTKSAFSGAAGGIAAGGIAGLTGAVATMGLTWVGVEGGFGVATTMAETWLALYGISVSPLAVIGIPALIIGGAVFHNEGKKAHDKAEKNFDKAELACQKFDRAIDFVNIVNERAIEIKQELNKLHEFYLNRLELLKKITAKKTDFNSFIEDEKYVLASTVILVKLLKEVLVQKLIDKVQDNQEEPVECNFKEIDKMVESTKAERIDLITKQHELVSDIKYIFQDDSVVVNPGKEDFAIDQNTTAYETCNKIISDKHVLFDAGLLVKGNVEFRNCVVDFNEESVISIESGKLTFKDCEIKLFVNYEKAHIYCEGGNLKFDNCIITNEICNDNDKMYDQEVDDYRCFVYCCNSEKNKSIISMENTQINSIENHFFVMSGTSVVTLDNCSVKNHKGIFAEVECDCSFDYSGITIRNTRFTDCKPYLRKKGENGFHLFGGNNPESTLYFAQENALILLKGSNCECDNVTFSNVTNYIVSLDSMISGKFVMKNSTVSNVRRLDSLSDKDPTIGASFGNMFIENCQFDDFCCKQNVDGNEHLVPGIETAAMFGEFKNESVINGCSFMNYKGWFALRYGMLNTSSFNDSELVVLALGNPHCYEGYQTKIENCEFNNCSAPNYMINCDSYCDKHGNAVFITNNKFKKCKTGGGYVDKYIHDIGAFGREKLSTIGVLSGNDFD